MADGLGGKCSRDIQCCSTPSVVFLMEKSKKKKKKSWSPFAFFLWKIPMLFLWENAPLSMLF